MELDLLMSVQEMHTPILDNILCNITALGDKGILWIAIGVILLCTKRYRKAGLLLLLSLLACFLVGNVVLKNLIQRDRPCWLYPEVELLIKNPTDYSFPSGHSMIGFAGATALWFANRKFGVAAYLLAAIIAFSRLYLFVHWPSDVLTGSIIGIIIPCLIFCYERKCQYNNKRTAEMDIGDSNENV